MPRAAQRFQPVLVAELFEPFAGAMEHDTQVGLRRCPELGSHLSWAQISEHSLPQEVTVFRPEPSKYHASILFPFQADLTHFRGLFVRGELDFFQTDLWEGGPEGLVEHVSANSNNICPKRLRYPNLVSLNGGQNSHNCFLDNVLFVWFLYPMKREHGSEPWSEIPTKMGYEASIGFLKLPKVFGVERKHLCPFIR